MYLWDSSKYEVSFFFHIIYTVCGWRKENDKEAAGFIFWMIYKNGIYMQKRPQLAFSNVLGFFFFFSSLSFLMV